MTKKPKRRVVVLPPLPPISRMGAWMDASHQAEAALNVLERLQNEFKVNGLGKSENGKKIIELDINSSLTMVKEARNILFKLMSSDDFN